MLKDPRHFASVALLAAAVCLTAAPAAYAQTPPPPPPGAPQAPVQLSGDVTPCSSAETDPAKMPPAKSPPTLRCLEPRFHPVNEPVVDVDTYLHYIKTPLTLPSKDVWAPYSEDALRADFWNLWRTGFLDNIWIEVIDEPWPNGVLGKHVIVHMEERSRVKVVDYVDPKGGAKLKVDVSKIETALRERTIEVRLDSFVDQAVIRRVIGVIKELHAEQGYQFATVEPKITPLAGSTKLVHLVFTINEGPKVSIEEVAFDGNKAFSDKKLRGQLKENKAKSGWLGWILGGGTYQEAKFAEDAERLRDYYQNRGYAFAQIGQQQIEVLRDSKDGKTRYVRLRVPIDEGERYRIGSVKYTGNTVVTTTFLERVFKLQAGEWFSRKKIAKGIEKAREAYGSLGFMHWQPVPEVKPRTAGDGQTPASKDGKDPAAKDEGQAPATPLPAPPAAAVQSPSNGKPSPLVDITMKMEEGKRYFVNRITFTGNTTTRDNVVRREMRVYEEGVFNYEALKESVRRLNQLGYFKPLEGKPGEVDIQDTPGTDNKVDVKLKFEEQNRNQLAFGAGVSQFDGFFGQLSFQTSNFMGRGETLGVSLQRGSQARNYQVSFSEPYLFDRPITVGMDVFAREYIYPLTYTQDSIGTNVVVGVPVRSFSRLYMGYSYEEVKVKDINPAYLPANIVGNPALEAAFLVNLGGHRTISKVTPSFVHNTVSHPIFPSSGKRYTLGLELAGLGGNTNYWQTRAEAIWYKPLTPKTSVGVRVEANYVKPYGSTLVLPIFEKFFLGGEYSVRGFDIRTIGPRDPNSGLVTGGNKSLLFNAEYYFNIAGPVRVLAFYDAGQVRDVGQRLGWWEYVTELVPPPGPILIDPLNFSNLTDPSQPIVLPTTNVLGRRNAFKTSTGLELRFFMPVLNVPFRLIAAYNPQRGGVLNNNLQLTPKFTFRFAVGTTF